MKILPVTLMLMLTALFSVGGAPDDFDLIDPNYLVCPGQNPSLDRQWIDFKQKFNKIYKSFDDECMRRRIVEKVIGEIEEHNELYRKGRSTFKMGLNSHSDNTEAEWYRMSHGVLWPSPPPLSDGLEKKHVFPEAVFNRPVLPGWPIPPPPLFDELPFLTPIIPVLLDNAASAAQGNNNPILRGLASPCPLHYNLAIIDYSDNDSFLNETPHTTSSAQACQRLCKRSRNCTRWSWIQKGELKGRRMNYFGGHKRHRCLMRSGEDLMEGAVEAFGVISGSRDCQKKSPAVVLPF